MADIITKATRIGYAEGLLYLGETDEKVVVLDADLAGATQTAKFKQKHPDRFFDCGIAEQNMIGIASGLSLSGFTVFASSFAMFASGRAFEQIRNSVGYPHLNVKIGATHAGISVGEDGASHQCNEDIALMRSIPGMTVIVPSDDTEARAAVRAALDCAGPVYIRLGRLAAPVINDPVAYDFKMGRGVTLREGGDVTIVATGLMVAAVIEAAEALSAKGVAAEVINIHTVKPLDEELVRASAKKTGRVVTCEEHSIIGGLGDAVLAALASDPVPVRKVGINDVFGESGPALELLKKYGLDATGIEREVLDFLKD